MILRWALTLLAVFCSFVIAGIFGGIAAGLSGLCSLPGAGFSAAFSVVVVAYLSAPNHRFRTATVALILGVVVAWLLLEPSFYPESYGEREAYQLTHLPVVATYLGGLLGLLVSALIQRWAWPDNSLRPTPLRGAA